MEELGIVLDFKAKTMAIDEIVLPMRNINHLQGASASMLRASTQDATKRATRILDTKYKKQISS
jgi:hypothetical protein